MKKSEEVKRKMSETRKGCTPWNKGRKMTDEKKEAQRNRQKY